MSLYEVVSGQILIGHRPQYLRMHKEHLLQPMQEVGIEPVVLLITEVGRFERFLEIYRYADYADYEKKRAALLAKPTVQEYQRKAIEWLDGCINVELMQELNDR